MGGLRPRDIALLAPLLATLLAGTLMAMGARGADSALPTGQERTSRLPAAEVERAVRTVPEPGSGTGRATAASCRPAGRGALRNPWSCTVTYATGGRARLAVTVAEDGSYVGRYSGGGTVRGCCLRLPGS